jgi:hypothetical protein
MTNFSFSVRDSKGSSVVNGKFVDGVGASFKMANGLVRDMIENAVCFLNLERAAISCNLVNGYVVERLH